MQVIITAVGPDHRGLADPIVHDVTSSGANIHEIQMYDHDSERLFAMLLRTDWPAEDHPIGELRQRMNDIGKAKGLSIRTWSRDEHNRPPRLAICTTYRPEPARAILQAVRNGEIAATPAVIIGNRDACRDVAEEFGVDWRMIGDEGGNPDNERMTELLDEPNSLLRFQRGLIDGQRACWSFDLHNRLIETYGSETGMLSILSSREACGRFRTAAFQPRVEAILVDALVERVYLREQILELQREVRELEDLLADLEAIDQE